MSRRAVACTDQGAVGKRSGPVTTARFPPPSALSSDRVWLDPGTLKAVAPAGACDAKLVRSCRN